MFKTIKLKFLILEGFIKITFKMETIGDWIYIPSHDLHLNRNQIVSIKRIDLQNAFSPMETRLHIYTTASSPELSNITIFCKTEAIVAHWYSVLMNIPTPNV